MKILVVCTGNTCRSPMAEALIKTFFSEGGRQVEVSSAGLHALEDQPASQYALEAVREYGADLAGHKARKVTREMIERAQLILSMTVGQKNNLIQMFPGVQDKVYTLKEFAYIDVKNEEVKMLDIPDPFGMSLDAYKNCCREIHAVLQRVCKRIENEYLH